MEISYRLKPYLQDKYEHKFFGILKDILSQESHDWVILPQVQVGRIINMTCQPFSSKCEYYLFHGMNQLSFDYVIFNKSLQPLLAIELDGSTHTKISRKRRDMFLEEICNEAQLPLLRVSLSNEYDTAVLKKNILEKM